eukprot:351140-Chlamydomonas_euryale.AAC.52
MLARAPWLREGHGLTKTEPEPACLWGVTRFGDNIEDEWVVVSLLMQLSIHLPVSIQVSCTADSKITCMCASIWHMMARHGPVLHGHQV